jgi:hypothetical protein
LRTSLFDDVIYLLVANRHATDASQVNVTVTVTSAPARSRFLVALES